MTKNAAIIAVCDIVGMAFHSMADYNKSSDCFCSPVTEGSYNNDGDTIAYVRKAVFDQLRRDGFDVKE